jgi:diguanylate cyclase (GGDEF)-like protein
LTAAYLDLDNFKEVNDRLGHAAGDALLHDVAATLHTHTRATDLVARLGGDEFALLFPDTEAAGAATLLGRLHATLLQEMAGKGWPTTCSMGAATFFQAPRDVDVMLRRVDALMYSAKRGGKGRIQHEAVHGPVETPQANAHQAERRAAVWILCNRAVRVTLDGVSNDQQWLAKIRDISLKAIALGLPCRLQEGALLTIEPLHDSRARTLLVRVLRTGAAPEGWLHECHLSNDLSDQELQAWLT